MKNFVLLSIFLISFNALALDECKRMEIKGTHRMIDGDVYLFVNENTQSQIKILVSFSEAHKAAPYFDIISLGTYVVKNSPPQGAIVKIEKIQRDLPDPLNPKKHSFVIQKGEAKCI